MVSTWRWELWSYTQDKLANVLSFLWWWAESHHNYDLYKQVVTGGMFYNKHIELLIIVHYETPGCLVSSNQLIPKLCILWTHWTKKILARLQLPDFPLSKNTSSRINIIQSEIGFNPKKIIWENFGEMMHIEYAILITNNLTNVATNVQAWKKG